MTAQISSLDKASAYQASLSMFDVDAAKHLCVDAAKHLCVDAAKQFYMITVLMLSSSSVKMQ